MRAPTNTGNGSVVNVLNTKKSAIAVNTKTEITAFSREKSGSLRMMMTIETASNTKIAAAAALNTRIESTASP